MGHDVKLFGCEGEVTVHGSDRTEKALPLLFLTVEIQLLQHMVCSFNGLLSFSFLGVGVPRREASGPGISDVFDIKIISSASELCLF